MESRQINLIFSIFFLNVYLKNVFPDVLACSNLLHILIGLSFQKVDKHCKTTSFWFDYFQLWVQLSNRIKHLLFYLKIKPVVASLIIYLHLTTTHKPSTSCEFRTNYFTFVPYFIFCSYLIKIIIYCTSGEFYLRWIVQLLIILDFL